MSQCESDQVKLCQLVRYFRSGDHASFKRICSLIGYDDSDARRKYDVPNLFTASVIAGLIEAVIENGLTQWRVCFSEDIHIDSVFAKMIYTTPGSLRGDLGATCPLISDFNGAPLIFGSKVANRSKHSHFGSRIFERCPDFQEIERRNLVEDISIFSAEAGLERFSFTNGEWESASEISSSGLHRIKRRFAGSDYFIVSEPEGLAFRIVSRDWAHVLAIRVLGLKPEELLRISDRKISIHRRVWIPNILLRILFGNSAECRIGGTIDFIDPDPITKISFENYILGYGDNNEIRYA